MTMFFVDHSSRNIRPDLEKKTCNAYEPFASCVYMSRRLALYESACQGLPSAVSYFVALN